jgi:hypothetical protein
MFKKIKDWLGANLDVYKVEKADDVGAGLVRHKWQGEQTATQTGTTLTADILNNFQKGLIPFVETVRTTGTDKDIYTVSVNGLKEFGLFDGLKLLLQIDNENQYNNSVININDSEYPLYSVKNGANETVKKGSLRAKGYYFITYNQNAFYLNAGNVLGTEADTALEGKRLAEIIGLEFGGNIQDTGAKTTGKFYYDKALKYYYECIVNNNLTYNDGSKFRAISNKPISDKVEKLSGITALKGTEIDSRITNYFSDAWLYKIGDIVIFSGLLDKNLPLINTPGTVLLNLRYTLREEMWVEPFFTIRKNGNLEIGAYATYPSNKINSPKHVSFMYITNS